MNGKNMRVAGLSAALVLTACSGSETTVESVPIEGQSGNAGGDSVVVASERRLKSIGSEQAFYDALRDALVAQNLNNYGPTPQGDEDAIFLESADSPTALPSQPAPSAGADFSSDSSVSDQASASAGSNATSGSLDVTTTNVQEIGVDEQDIIKSDGEYLYVLKREFENIYYGPEVINTPAQPLEEEVASRSRQFEKRLSLLAPPANQKTTLRILSLQPEVPTASVLAELPIELNQQSATGLYLHKTDGQDSVVMASSSGSGFYGYWGDPYAFNDSSSKLTKVDVSNPALATVTDTITIDGQIISSRRIGNQLFFASRHYPALPDATPFGSDPETWQNTLNATDLSSVLPTYTTSSSGVSTALVNPAECFVAQQPNDRYYTPDIISLVSVNIDTMEVSDSACYLGSSETLYASPQAVYLATTRWDYNETVDFGETIDSTEQGTTATSTTANEVDFVSEPAIDSVFYDPRQDTDIHKFAIGDGTLDYVGSGTVTGHLGWNSQRKPYRMSEHNNRLRVITHSASQSKDVSPVNVTVLESNAAGELSTVGVLPNAERPEHIGKPFESLYATKFLGDQAYLVTFRQTDPLYVVDLSSASDPFVAGELEIDGYSDFLQPVGEGYLLGIGKDAIADPNNGGGLVQGVKLSLFDVRDASNPIEVDTRLIGQRGTDSGALQDQRGITVQMANERHPTRVAISVHVYGDPNASRPSANDAWRYYDYNYTGLHGFEINLGDSPGINFVGALRANSNSGFPGFGGYGDDRSVIVNDATYYVYESQVYAANWNDLTSSTGPN